MSQRPDFPEGPFTAAQMDELESPPCPKCGASSTFQWVTVPATGGTPEMFLPGLIECTARCWENDTSFQVFPEDS